MELTELKNYCLSKPFVTDDYPFGPDVHVFRVGNKMFALFGEHEGTLGVNLKCDPNEALALRDVFDSVNPGYHMNKVHWNTVKLRGDVPDGEFKRMVDNSYQLVYSSLPKSKIKQLEDQNNLV